jgi:hypothetical protein
MGDNEAKWRIQRALVRRMTDEERNWHVAIVAKMKIKFPKIAG